MVDLVDFLRARFDEDEQVAREAAANYDETEWRLSVEGDLLSAKGGAIATGPWEGPILPEGDHIARHDPARTLREVAAKRRMLDELYPEIQGMDEAIEGEWGGESNVADTLIRLLALPYADHPDYREEWRP